MKEIFTKNSLEKCKSIKFEFKDSINLESSIEDDISISDIPVVYDEVVDGEFKEEDVESPNKEQVYMVESDRDVKLFNKRNNSIELPPKDGNGKVILEDFKPIKVVCKCDPNNPEQVCPECIDNKL